MAHQFIVKLTVAMLKTILTFLILFQSSAVSITSPVNGDTLRGQIQILGSMDYPTFASAELGFKYASSSEGASDSGDTWFTIQTFSQPILDSAIAVWDTTSLTDGDYDLRLRVFLQDGTVQDAIVTGLKVRNQELPTATVTNVPLPQFNTNETPTPILSEPTAVNLSLPSATLLPSNPASITVNSIYKIFGQSALVVLVLFVLFSFIIRLRKN
ncbi:MAG: hypothetical protein HC797_05400 [Anaerolineales bacterium]|nr:hypothetical protein [Anaerolineales bacterium]